MDETTPDEGGRAGNDDPVEAIGEEAEAPVESPDAEVAASDPEETQASTPAEKREHERFEVRRSATVTPIHEGETLGRPIEGRFVDVSRGGACLRLPNMMHPGSRALIQAPSASGEFLEAAEVRWVRYESGVGTLVGFRFDRSPLAQELVSRFRRSGLSDRSA